MSGQKPLMISRSPITVIKVFRRQLCVADSKRLQGRIGGIGYGHSGRESRAQVIDDRLGEPLPGHHHWNSGRITAESI